MDWSGFKTIFHTNNTWAVPVYGNVQRSRSLEPYNNSKNDRGHKRHRYYKYILIIILSGSFPSQTLAETIGGVSATASPVACNG